jgi:hypothetical protein
MSDPSEQPTQSMGEATEPCRSCGALLAVDQRYCLNGGQRRGDPRIDFRTHLPGPPAASNGAASASPEPPPVAPPAAEKAQPQRDYTPLAAVGGIAVLGLMLLVGVLIGQGNNPSPSTTPTQLIVPAETGDGAATASEEGTGGEAATATKTAKAAGKAKVKGKKAENASSLLNSKGGGPVVASDEALQELEEGSGASYSENSAKLPDEIATGGAPPPKDNKAPGGGSKGTAIE